MLLGVQVDATGPFLYGHYREAHINAAVKFPFLDLRQAGWQGCSVSQLAKQISCFILLSHPQTTKKVLFIINSAKEVMGQFICLLFVREKKTLMKGF